MRQMKLDEVHLEIDEKIMARGLHYYLEGRVRLKKSKGNSFSFIVEGTNNYAVEVELSDEQRIMQSYCNCPYGGEHCKHEAAVYYALQDWYEDEEPPSAQEDEGL